MGCQDPDASGTTKVPAGGGPTQLAQPAPGVSMGVGGGAPDAQEEKTEDEEDALEKEIQALEKQVRDYRAAQRRLERSLMRAMNQKPKNDNEIKRLQDELAKTVGDLKSANALLAGKSKVPGYVVS
jgi:septal ring factor EnvC (AmiA/AmiB activator)